MLTQNRLKLFLKKMIFYFLILGGLLCGVWLSNAGAGSIF